MGVHHVNLKSSCVIARSIVASRAFPNPDGTVWWVLFGPPSPLRPRALLKVIIGESSSSYNRLGPGQGRRVGFIALHGGRIPAAQTHSGGSAAAANTTPASALRELGVPTTKRRTRGSTLRTTLCSGSAVFRFVLDARGPVTTEGATFYSVA